MNDASVYDSERLANAYARSRPPVHRQLIAAAKERLQALGVPRATRALDIGCGAGLSTAALEPLAEGRVGLEPVATMLRHHGVVAPDARFAIGRAEDLPFADGSFQLVTAAGSLNYADRDRALPEIARVLTAPGVLLIYDFSSGRRVRDDPRLDAWFEAFLDRYPYPPGYSVDVRGMPFARAGLTLECYEPHTAAVSMSEAEYLAYAMSETNVETALSQGASEAGIRDWCAAGLHDLFALGRREVLFEGYMAYVRKP